MRTRLFEHELVASNLGRELCVELTIDPVLVLITVHFENVVTNLLMAALSKATNRDEYR